MSAFFLSLIVFVLIVLRQNMVLVLLVCAAYVQVVLGKGILLYVIEDLWSAMDNHALLAIPMYLVLGTLMSRGSMAENLIRIFRSATDWMPGGLGLATTLSCAFFAAMSGSSAATLLAVGTVMYPALTAAGYSGTFAIGAVTTVGTLGILIPPSIPLIVFGLVTDTSIADLFRAAVLPGVLMALVFSLYGIVTNREVPRGQFSLARLIASLQGGFFAASVPVILLGGIYSGIFSVTEAAAAVTVYAAVVELLIHRSLRPSELVDVLKSAAVMSGTLLPIVAVALMLKSLLIIEGVPDAFAGWVLASFDNKVAILLTLNVALLIVGCLIDVVSAILLLAPMMLAVGAAIGVNTVHLGIIMVVNLEIGLLTPPVGMNLLISSRLLEKRLSYVARTVVPFVLLMLGALIFVTFSPWLSLVLIE